MQNDPAAWQCKEGEPSSSTNEPATWLASPATSREAGGAPRLQQAPLGVSVKWVISGLWDRGKAETGNWTLSCKHSGVGGTDSRGVASGHKDSVVWCRGRIKGSLKLKCARSEHGSGTLQGGQGVLEEVHAHCRQLFWVGAHQRPSGNPSSCKAGQGPAEDSFFATAPPLPPPAYRY